MLVFGDRVLITGYSYRHRATELSVFRLDTATGRLAREGVFYMSSNDYYSSSNYATRLIGDNLVIYTPFQRRRHDPGRRSNGRSCAAGAPTTSARSTSTAAAGRCSTPAEIYRPVRAGRGSDRPHRLGLPAGRGRLGARPRMPHHRLHRPEHVAMVCDRERRLPVDGVARLSVLRPPGLRPRPGLRGELRAGLALPGAGRRRRARAGRRARHAARPILAAGVGRPLPRLAQGPAALLQQRAQHRGAARPISTSRWRASAARVREVAPRPLHAAARRQVALHRQPLHRPLPRLWQPRPVPARPFAKMRCRPLMWCRSTGRGTCAPLGVAPHRGPRRAGRQRHRADRLSRRRRPVRHPDRPRRAAAHRLVGAARASASRARAAATPSTA